MKNILIIILLFLCFNLFSDQYKIIKLKKVVSVKILNTNETTISNKCLIISSSKYEKNKKYNAYYFQNKVMFFWICFDVKDNYPMLLFWSDEKDFVYRDDLFITYKNDVVSFVENGIKIKIKIQELE